MTSLDQESLAKPSQGQAGDAENPSESRNFALNVIAAAVSPKAGPSDQSITSNRKWGFQQVPSCVQTIESLTTTKCAQTRTADLENSKMMLADAGRDKCMVWRLQFATASDCLERWRPHAGQGFAQLHALRTRWRDFAAAEFQLQARSFEGMARQQTTTLSTLHHSFDVALLLMNASMPPVAMFGDRLSRWDGVSIAARLPKTPSHRDRIGHPSTAARPICAIKSGSSTAVLPAPVQGHFRASGWDEACKMRGLASL